MSKDTIYREDAIKVVRHASMEFVDADTRQRLIEAIPSADRPPNPHDITYINALKNRIKELEAKRPQGEMNIDIKQEDFGTLCVCALRYCHGRQTYMPSLVQQIVTAHFKDLSDRDLQVIADDGQYQADMGLWGDACDKADWDRFYRALLKCQKERNR